MPTSTRTIGLLADWFDERYQHSILTTAEEAAAQRATHLLAFSGGIPGSSARDGALRQRGYRLITPQNVDGVILLAGTMVNALGPDGLAELLKPLNGLPTCAIGVELPGVPSIIIDNQAGIDQAMNHLVSHHSCREVAFIRGPNKNKEAESRFTAYRAALARAEIAYDPKLVFQGDFLRESGERAIAHWRSEELTPKAIIAANDEMALGALRALAQAGVKVPEETRVIGFDDMVAARHASPTLTTVRQPLSELAVTAIRTVMDQIHGREVPALQMLQTHLVVRDSCGCTVRLTSSGRSLFPEEESTLDSEGFEPEFNKVKTALRAELTRIARGEFQRLRDWENKLMAGFSRQVGGTDDSFVEILALFLSKTSGAGGEVERFQDIITAFRRTALPCCGPNLAQRTRVENILQEARLVVARATQREHANKQLARESYTQTFAQVAATLTGSFELATLRKAIEAGLPRLGITACTVVAYCPLTLGRGVADDTPSQSRVIASYGGDNPAPAELFDTDFATGTLLPNSLIPTSRTHQPSVLPLFLKGQELGYCVLEARRHPRAEFELIREQLSVALYGCLLSK